eukprot:Gregarina_sp_Poly_1__6230@NODE_32_length_19284_cov_132_623615_g29_i0_p3_GENE_NODE_32_length_19284_cov_132_623615_g29_i0NODE_32_length_19284_cov_132_623615_g29_i0_p3_ORF_typecomplete_len731_score118_62NOG1_N/PF17835_1/1_5e65NOG1/PF06858_14/3_9e26FeoB_N/PF02421_18/2_1e22NOGCT/PF08155_11/3_3e22MMR_HSR1/PF01926_23/3_9e17Ras/PF00071_22/1_9e07RsgA_GTPase/PF03193_16/0_00048RsgA_GTPase/PF03193_16/28AIG1/PF04548_16/6_8e06SRPRB/PF09439_10/1_1e05Arf/PF00025_21/1_7e05MnmE_helical/PF12631_7/4_6e05PduVEutP/PF
MVTRNAADQSLQYRFKDITTVASAKDLVDICLSRTQRKTPTQVHPQYAISRIREFYMRKVKYCQQSFHDKLTTVLDQFPRLDDIHPFYSNLLNVLYDKDHYKLALGQVNSVRGVIDTIGKEYVKLLKFADSAYKCKMLKRAALGRMCTTVKKLNKVLTYLEEVRQHLSRLPGINPYARTLLLAGHPNVGKSSFMNALSHANVEVEPFPFTTKAPYVGHFNFDFADWQVVDTPGILDRPLISRNSVEMTAITALAYLQCAILFLIDISEQCGYSIEEQVKLFHATKQLFKSKPILVVCNKVDLRNQSELTQGEIDLIKSMEDGVDNIRFTYCSTLTQLNLDETKNEACQMLLDVQNQRRLMAGKPIKTGLDGLYVPDVPINESRPPFVPAAFLQASRKRLASRREAEENEMADATLAKRLLERDLMEEYGGAGVYDIDDRKHWDLENSDWCYDKLPEFYDGKNVADFIDQDIEQKLRQLEEEEAQIEALWNSHEQGPTEEWFVHQELLKTMHDERQKRRMASQLKKKRNYVVKPRVPVDVEDIKNRLHDLGIDSTGVINSVTTSRGFQPVVDSDKLLLNEVGEDPTVGEDSMVRDETPSPVAARRGRLTTPRTVSKRAPSVVRPHVAAKNVKLEVHARKKIRTMSLTRRQDSVGAAARKQSLLPAARNTLQTDDAQRAAELLKARSDARYRKPSKGAPRRDQIHEADRFIGTKMPKHLFSGKRGLGKTDRR